MTIWQAFKEHSRVSLTIRAEVSHVIRERSPFTGKIIYVVYYVSWRRPLQVCHGVGELHNALRRDELSASADYWYPQTQGA